MIRNRSSNSSCVTSLAIPQQEPVDERKDQEQQQDQHLEESSEGVDNGRNGRTVEEGDDEVSGGSQSCPGDDSKADEGRIGGGLSPICDQCSDAGLLQE